MQIVASDWTSRMVQWVVVRVNTATASLRIGGVQNTVQI